MSTGAPSASAPASSSDSNNGQHFGALAHPGADSFAHGWQGQHVEIPHGSSFGGPSSSFQAKERR